MKPYSSEDFREVMKNARLLTRRQKKRVFIRTFGRFDLMIDDQVVDITNSKAKELLALCVAHKGGQVSIEEAVDLSLIHISWTKIKSGDVTGYVCSDYIIIGNNAEQKAQEIVEEKQEEFVYAESREAEEERLAKEAEEKAKEAEAKTGTGQAIVDLSLIHI